MGNPLKDMTGQKIGKLFFLQRAENRTSPSGQIETYWQVKCDCGNLFEIGRSNVGRTFQCDLCARMERGKNRQLPPGIVLRNGVLADYKKNAKLRSLKWLLTDDQAIQLFQGNCHYCGIAPNTVLSTPPSYGGPRWTFTYNGIDRKNNAFGYEESNVVSCCKFCQYAKRDLSYEEFLGHLMRAGQHQLNQRTTEASIGR
jgi:hypothetical protein